MVKRIWKYTFVICTWTGREFDGQAFRGLEFRIWKKGHVLWGLFIDGIVRLK